MGFPPVKYLKYDLNVSQFELLNSTEIGCIESDALKNSTLKINIFWKKISDIFLKII